MKTPKKIRVAVALMACVGMLSPAATFGAMPATAPSVKDAKLTGDALVGKVVDAQGNAVASAKVAVRRAGQAPKVVATNANGQFSIAGLNGGVYQVTTQGTTANYRVWTATAAPPVASEGILLVDNNATVTRGQCAGGGCANSAPAYGGGAVYGAPVEMAAPAYGGGAVYGDAGGAVYGGGGGGEVIYGGGGGCDGGGAAYGGGAGYPVDAGYVADGGYGYGGAVAGGGGCGGGGFGLGGGGLGGLGGGCGGGFLGFLSSPWVIGAGVAAAIAIPLALDDDDDNNANGNGNGAGNNGGGAAS